MIIVFACCLLALTPLLVAAADGALWLVVLVGVAAIAAILALAAWVNAS